MLSLVLKTGTTKKTAGAYQEPEVPDVEREAAQHLDHGCQQDHILEMPEGRKAKHERSIPAPAKHSSSSANTAHPQHLQGAPRPNSGTVPAAALCHAKDSEESQQ